MDKETKSNLNMFTKLNGAFFVIAYSFMFLSIGFFLYSKNSILLKNTQDVQINVANPQEGAESDVTIESRIRNLIPTSSVNPNLLDAEAKKKILDTARKKDVVNYYVVVNLNGVLNPKTIDIELGDSVTFLNSSGEKISIMGEGWGMENLEDSKTFTQEFFIPKKHSFKIKEFNVENVVNVVINN